MAAGAGRPSAGTCRVAWQGPSGVGRSTSIRGTGVFLPAPPERSPGGGPDHTRTVIDPGHDAHPAAAPSAAPAPPASSAAATPTAAPDYDVAAARARSA